MFWLVFWFLVCVAILAYGIRRMANHDYRFGSGLFKSSDSNLDEKDEFVDKDYYDKKNLLNNIKQNLRLLSCSKSLCCKTLPYCTGAFLILLPL